ncbi:hypothetical protein BN1263460135 [Stenotrophomonas indicatrix]|nr:hypothetical protein BN1263460135 [Stenotrophomonas indicatrix]
MQGLRGRSTVGGGSAHVARSAGAVRGPPWFQDVVARDLKPAADKAQAVPEWRWLAA